MSKLVWDKTGERFYETGVENGVLYVRNSAGAYPKGVAWNGLSNISESPSGAEATPIYADNIKYLNLMSVEEFGATIEAYFYPDEFAECDGTAELAPGVFAGQQPRKVFGLVYKTLIGNDVDLNDHGYKLHLIYGAQAAPSEKAYPTVNDSPEAVTFSWELTTTPVNVVGMKPTAQLTIDSTKVDPLKLAALEAVLFGKDADIVAGTPAVVARLPLPDEVKSIITSAAPTTLTLVSASPADNSSEIPLDTLIVLTFNNKIKANNISVETQAGVPVVGVKAWDAAEKVLTFTPSANLTADTVYVVNVAGVVDTYDQTLTTVLVDFETVA